MSYIQFIDRLKHTDYLIRTQGTGSAEQLANRLGVTRRRVFHYLEFMKDKGAEISFDRKKTFYYENDFTLFF